MYRNVQGSNFQAVSQLAYRPLTDIPQQYTIKHPIKTDKMVATIVTGVLGSSFSLKGQEQRCGTHPTDKPAQQRTGFLRENKARRGRDRSSPRLWKSLTISFCCVGVSFVDRRVPSAWTHVAKEQRRPELMVNTFKGWVFFVCVFSLSVWQ